MGIKTALLSLLKLVLEKVFYNCGQVGDKILMDEKEKFQCLQKVIQTTPKP